MAKFVGSLRVPRALRLRLASVLLGVTTAACATANDQSIPPGDDGSGGSDVSAAGTATEGGSSDPAAGSFGISGASSSFGGGAAGQSAAGAAGSNAAFGGTGSGIAGSSSGGGVSSFGGAPATGGTASTGGSAAVGGTASSAGGAIGAAGTGAAGAGTAGSTSSAGAAGATGGTGCTAPPWTAGFAYTVGAVVTGVCQNIGGGSTVCVAGKKYPWTCFGSTCAVYQPGADGWWGNWTVGTACD